MSKLTDKLKAKKANAPVQIEKEIVPDPRKGLRLAINAAKSSSGKPNNLSLRRPNPTSPQANETGKKLQLGGYKKPNTSELSNDTKAEAARDNVGNELPTLDDVANFVFEEQPDALPEEITLQFEQTLHQIVEATGFVVGDNIRRAMQFIKDHPFIAENLKPEDIGILVSGLRKSYGIVAKTKREGSQRRSKKQERVNDVLADLDGLVL